MIKMIEKVKREKPELSCLNMRIEPTPATSSAAS